MIDYNGEQYIKYSRELKRRYDNLKEEHIDTITRNEDYRARIDKAIEYIKQYGNLYCLKHKQFKDYHQYKVLLDILQGSDKE